MTAQTLSQKVASDLRDQIADGRLPVGAPIPSQTQLVEHYDVSTSVTRKAVDQLRTEGLLVGQPGKAVYVQTTPREVAAETRHVEALAERLSTLEDDVRALTADSGTGADLSVIDDVRNEIAHLRRQVATLRSHLMDLYSRVGHPYPRDEELDPGANTAPPHTATGTS